LEAILGGGLGREEDRVEDRVEVEEERKGVANGEQVCDADEGAQTKEEGWQRAEPVCGDGVKPDRLVKEHPARVRAVAPAHRATLRERRGGRVGREQGPEVKGRVEGGGWRQGAGGREVSGEGDGVCV
jgi:hypothetical protein